MSAFQPIMISCIYENVLFGNYNMITFAHQDFKHTAINKIHNQVDRYDYTGSLPNRISPLKLKSRYGSRKSCWPKNCDPALYEKHYDIYDSGISDEIEKFSMECWSNYQENLQKFAHLKDLQNNCVFKFLCFFMTKSFYNTSFVSHNGARYM